MDTDQTKATDSRCRYGFLCILTNPCMPGLAKIGQTERHPRIRAVELSDHTGVPQPFEVACFFEVTDRFQAENVVLEALAEARLQNNREFYKIEAEDAARIVLEVAVEMVTFTGYDQLAITEAKMRVCGRGLYCQRCHQTVKGCVCAPYAPLW